VSDIHSDDGGRGRQPYPSSFAHRFLAKTICIRFSDVRSMGALSGPAAEMAAPSGPAMRAAPNRGEARAGSVVTRPAEHLTYRIFVRRSRPSAPVDE